MTGVQTCALPIYECLIRSALGNRPPELHWTWRPLFQPTAKERADMGKVLADSAKVLYDMDILPQEALADTIVNTLTESASCGKMSMS